MQFFPKLIDHGPLSSDQCFGEHSLVNVGLGRGSKCGKKSVDVVKECSCRVSRTYGRSKSQEGTQGFQLEILGLLTVTVMGEVVLWREAGGRGRGGLCEAYMWSPLHWSLSVKWVTSLPNIQCCEG